MDVQFLKDTLTEVSSAFPEVCLVYLFGSQVGEQVGPLSDIDLGVLLERGSKEQDVRARLTHELASALDFGRIDVLILNTAPVELAYAVLAQGILLYQRDLATRVEYEAQVLSRYGDYLPVLRAHRDDILQGDPNATRVQRYRAALRRTERTLGQIKATQGQTTR
jgi:predicted nucleotidyltransferase